MQARDALKMYRTSSSSSTSDRTSCNHLGVTQSHSNNLKYHPQAMSVQEQT